MNKIWPLQRIWVAIELVRRAPDLIDDKIYYGKAVDAALNCVDVRYSDFYRRYYRTELYFLIRTRRFLDQLPLIVMCWLKEKYREEECEGSLSSVESPT